MATLDPYFGPHSGPMRIFVSIFKVGSGDFSNFGDFAAGFNGNYQFMGQSGTVTLAVKLTDDNPDSQSGPCQVTLNDKSDNAASYQVNGEKLTLTTSLNDTPIDAYQSQGGTQIDNVSGHNLWIGP